MTRSQEKLLIAVLAGLVIAGTAAFVVSPTLAIGLPTDTPAHVSAITPLDMGHF